MPNRCYACIAVVLLLVTAAGCRTSSTSRVEKCPKPMLAPVEQATTAPLQKLQRSAAAPVPVTLIRNATVWTASGPILKETDVLIRHGKINRIGGRLNAPPGARIIDGTGKHLTPGLIDPHSHLGLYSSPWMVGTADGNEVGKPLSPAARVEDALWPQDPGISHALAAGVTTVMVVPGSANLVGGEGLIIKLGRGRTVEDLRFPGAPATLKMACGENPKRTYGSKGGPFTRMGNVARVRKVFQDAVEYQRKWQRYEASVQLWKKRRKKRCTKGDSGKEKGEQTLPPPPPKRDMDLETLGGVIQGSVKVHWHCYRADEMARLLEVAREFGFSIQAFHHAVESYKVRDLLQAHKTGVVSWVNWWGFKAESLDAIPENLALLATAGVVAAMHSDSPLVIQRLNQDAALAYYRGRDMGLNLSESDAIRFVTLNPARILGIDRFTGSIEEGKMADLTLWDQHPLTVIARSEKVFVDGQLVFDRLDPKTRYRTDFELGMVPNPLEVDRVPGESMAQPELPEGWSVPVRPTNTKAVPGAAVAIVGGTVYTMNGRTLKEGTVILQGDRVKAVGQNLRVPTGAAVINAKGLVVTPGLVAAETTLGLVEISAEGGTLDHSPGGKRAKLVRADLRAWDALNPASAAIGVTRIEGFTTAVIRAYGGLISGQAAAFDLQGLHPEQSYLAAPVAVHANLGLSSAGEVGGSRAVAMKQLRRLLDDTRILKQYGPAVERRRYRKLSAPFAELRALIPVVDRRIPLVVTVNRAADILAALRLGQQQKIRLVLSGAAEGWRVAEAIARARVPVLVEVDNNLPSSFDALAGRFDNAARLSRAGVVVGLSAAGGAHNVRSLRQLAGIAMAWGMPHQNALAAITAVPAATFGLADRGVLKAGARANVVVWNGDPLALSTRVQHLFIGGRKISLTSRQTQLRDRYRRLDR